MSQLETLARHLKAKRDQEITDAANKAALSILENLEPGFDPREVARRISQAVGEILDRRVTLK